MDLPVPVVGAGWVAAVGEGGGGQETDLPVLVVGVGWVAGVGEGGGGWRGEGQRTGRRRARR